MLSKIYETTFFCLYQRRRALVFTLKINEKNQRLTLLNSDKSMQFCCVRCYKKTVFFLFCLALLYATVSYIAVVSNIEQNDWVPLSFSYSNVIDVNDCIIAGLHQKHRIIADNRTLCQGQQVISSHSCDFVLKNYNYRSDRTCKTKRGIEVCKFVKLSTLLCTRKDCTREPIIGHALNPLNGNNEFVFKSDVHDADLTETVTEYSKRTANNGYEYIFLSCGNDMDRTQLLVLKGHYKTEPNNVQKKNANKININVLMLDSISRAHFYRSLRKTVHMFNQLNKNSPAEVLDFEKLQALHGHSAVNARAFFTGEMFPADYTDQMCEESAIGIPTLMNHFKTNGYHTLYQDDLCWKAIWGLRMDLGNPYDWEEFMELVKESFIDDTGLTHASCSIFDALGLEHMFNTESDDKICYNGQQQDFYYLKYLFQLYNNPRKRAPVFSYTALNVAHDFGGVRVQNIDNDLASFVRDLAKVETTLTVLFSDHGNTYTDFVYTDVEGRFEMYHPSMFFIVPKSVQMFLGKDVMHGLRTNQKRLITLLDLHKFLVHLGNETSLHQSKLSDSGIGKIIDENRTCSDLPLRTPNLCLCRDSFSRVKNNTDFIGHLEFAVGELNNMIAKASPKNRCKRLVPTSFDNILVQKTGKFTTTSLQIQTASGRGSANRQETFSVQLQTIETDSLDNFGMKLKNQDRLSMFGKYRQCSDAEPQFRFCVCNLRSDSRTPNDLFIASRTSPEYTIFGELVEEKRESLLEGSLDLIVRTYNEREKEGERYIISVTFEVVHTGHVQDFYVEVFFTNLNNLKPTSSSPCAKNVAARSVVFLCTLARKWNIWSADYSFETKFRVI